MTWNRAYSIAYVALVLGLWCFLYFTIQSVVRDSNLAVFIYCTLFVLGGAMNQPPVKWRFEVTCLDGPAPLILAGYVLLSSGIRCTITAIVAAVACHWANESWREEAGGVLIGVFVLLMHVLCSIWADTSEWARTDDAVVEPVIRGTPFESHEEVFARTKAAREHADPGPAYRRPFRARPSSGPGSLPRPKQLTGPSTAPKALPPPRRP